MGELGGAVSGLLSDEMFQSLRTYAQRANGQLYSSRHGQNIDYTAAGSAQEGAQPVAESRQSKNQRGKKAEAQAEGGGGAAQATDLVGEARSHEGECPEYFAVLDFEANCIPRPERDPAWADPKHQIPNFFSEIIEFPTVIVGKRPAADGGVQWAPLAEFRSFVRPWLHPEVTEFCTHLTGITQADVASAPEFPEVFEQWRTFMADYPGAVLVTCGDWDLRTCLPAQLANVRGETRSKSFFAKQGPVRRWCNLKLAVEKGMPEIFGEGPGGMAAMLAKLGLELEGKHHSGIDDCRNIAKVLIRMVSEKGAEAARPTTVGK